MMGCLLQFLTLHLGSQEETQLLADIHSAVIQALEAQATIKSIAADVRSIHSMHCSCRIEGLLVADAWCPLQAAYWKAMQLYLRIGMLVASVGIALVRPAAAPALIGLSCLERNLAACSMPAFTDTAMSPLLAQSDKLLRDLQVCRQVFLLLCAHLCAARSHMCFAPQANLNTTMKLVDAVAAAASATRSDVARMCRHDGAGDCVSCPGLDADCWSIIFQHKARLEKLQLKAKAKELNEDAIRVIGALKGAQDFCKAQLDVYRALLAQQNPCS